MVGGLVLFAEKGGMRRLHLVVYSFFLPVGLTSWQGFFSFFSCCSFWLLFQPPLFFSFSLVTAI